MSNGNRGGGLLLLAAIVVGASIVAGAWLVRSGLQASTTQLAGELETTRGSLDRLARQVQAAAQPQRPPTRNRPDPDERYEVSTSGAPALGPLAAKVQIVEFSDFQ